MTEALPPISELNALPRAEYVSALRPLFEAADPLAAALFDARPFASYGELIDRAEALAAQLPDAQQIEVANAHPRIGERPDRLSALSLREQGASAPPSVGAALAELNQQYEDHFGFRFVVFVNHRPRSEILEVLKTRLHNPRDQELATALRDMFAIARDRLKTL